MDVRMPDGTIVKNVPEGVTRKQLQARLAKMNAGSTQSEPPPPAPPSWGQVARRIPVDAARDTASLLATPLIPMSANLSPTDMMVFDPSGGVEQAQEQASRQMPSRPPENMTELQSGVYKGGKFAAESALFPASMGVRALNAGLGFLSGAAGDQVGRRYGPGAELATNVLTPVGALGVGKLGKAGLNKLADAVAVTRAGTDDWAFNRVARQAINRAASNSPADDLPAIQQTLRSGEATVPGVNPTVSEALSQGRAVDRAAPVRGGGLIAMERELSVMDPYQNAIAARSSRVADVIERMAGGRTTAERNSAANEIRNVEGAAVKSTFNEVQDKADKGRRVLDRLRQWRENKGKAVAGLEDRAQMGRGRADELGEQIPAMERTRINALQQEGQLRTGAASALAGTNRRDPLGPIEQQIAERDGPFIPSQSPSGQFPDQQMSPNPLQPNRAGFYPVEGQPRISGRYSPQVDRADEMTVAADEFADIAQQARQQMQETRGQMDELMTASRNYDMAADQVRGELGALSAVNVRSLQGQPLVDDLTTLTSVAGNTPETRRLANSVIREIKGSVDANGTVPASKLGQLRANMNDLIEAASRGSESTAKKLKAGSSIQIKNMIDNAFGRAGVGDEWQSALRTYGDYATRLDRQKVLDLLAKSVRPGSDGKIRSDQFLKWTGDDEAALLKQAKIDSNLTSLSELIGPDDYAKLQGVRQQLIREDIAGAVKTGPSQAEVMKPPQMINVLNPKVAALNWALRFTSQANQAAVKNRLVKLMQDPRIVADMLEAQKKGIPFNVWQRSIPGLIQYPSNQLSQTLEESP